MSATASKLSCTVWFALGITLTVVGCAASQVRPDDQSAEAHRAQAAREQAEADAHRNQYDANAQVLTPETHGLRAEVEVSTEAVRSYNPTAWHLRKADEASAHARAHQAAAAELEAFEVSECRDFAPKVRSACPVAGPVRGVEDLANGVRFVIADGAPIDVVAAHMRCHLAWARTRGFAKLPGCPIYIKGIAIKLAADRRSIEVTSPDRSVVRELKQRSHEEASHVAVL